MQIKSDVPVTGVIGLKRNQWPDKDSYAQIARECLEGKGLSVSGIKCFKKTRSGVNPELDPNTVNIFLRLTGGSTIDIVA